LLQMFLEIQIQAAYADGRPGPNKEQLLLYICRRLAISESVFRHLAQVARLQQEFSAGIWGHEEACTPQRPTPREAPLNRAYKVLGRAQGYGCED